MVGGGSRNRDHRDFDSGPAAPPLEPVPKSQEHFNKNYFISDLWCESSTNIQRILTLDFLILGLALPPPPFPRTAVKILQKTDFSLVKSMLALGSPICLFVCLSPCRKWPHTQENGCYCPPVITNKTEIKIQILISWVNTWAARPPPPTRCQSRAGGCPWKTVRGGCPWKQLPGGCPWKTITTYSVFLFRRGGLCCFLDALASLKTMLDIQ